MALTSAAKASAPWLTAVPPSSVSSSGVANNELLVRGSEAVCRRYWQATFVVPSLIGAVRHQNINCAVHVRRI
jgi:hypothetical protein